MTDKEKEKEAPVVTIKKPQEESIGQNASKAVEQQPEASSAEQEAQVQSQSDAQPADEPTAINPFVAQLGSIRDDYDAAEAEYNTKQAELNEYRQKVADANKNKSSVLKAITERAKPEYDEDRAKKLRNIAIVQSLGDMLSAAARGYFAYRKGGAGVVPNVKADSPFKPIEELNKMRETYLTNHKEWKDLMAATELKAAEAEEAAANALLTKKEAEVKESKSNKEAVRKLYDEWFKSYLESEEKKEAAELKRINDNEQKELERQTRREIAQANNATREAIKAMGNNSDKSNFTAEDYALLDEYNKAFPLTKSEKDSDGIKVDKPYTQSDYDKMSKEEKSARLARARAWKASKTPTLGTQSTSTSNSKSEYDVVVANLKTRGFSEEDAKTKALEFLKSKYGDNWGYKSYIMQ